MTFVLLDEREDSINDGYFVLLMDGYLDPKSASMADFPASYHNGAAAFAFADGHSEIHKWCDQRTMPKLVPGKSVEHYQTQPNNVDIIWMDEHSTRTLH